MTQFNYKLAVKQLFSTNIARHFCCHHRRHYCRRRRQQQQVTYMLDTPTDRRIKV
jgi:hypothetical protein